MREQKGNDRQNGSKGYETDSKPSKRPHPLQVGGSRRTTGAEALLNRGWVAAGRPEVAAGWVAAGRPEVAPSTEWVATARRMSGAGVLLNRAGQAQWKGESMHINPALGILQEGPSQLV